MPNPNTNSEPNPSPVKGSTPRSETVNPRIQLMQTSFAKGLGIMDTKIRIFVGGLVLLWATTRIGDWENFWRIGG
jgi:hypothetical protein